VDLRVHRMIRKMEQQKYTVLFLPYKLSLSKLKIAVVYHESMV